MANGSRDTGCVYVCIYLIFYVFTFLYDIRGGECIQTRRPSGSDAWEAFRRKSESILHAMFDGNSLRMTHRNVDHFTFFHLFVYILHLKRLEVLFFSKWIEVFCWITWKPLNDCSKTTVKSDEHFLDLGRAHTLLIKNHIMITKQNKVIIVNAAATLSFSPT